LIGAALVLLLGMADLRRAAAWMVASVALGVVFVIAADAAGFGVGQMIIDRAATTFLFSDVGMSGPSIQTGIDSNIVKLEQARVLLGHIQEKPIVGWGFGAIAPDYAYGDTFSYELSYLDITYKTGLVGLLLFLSLPLRFLFDGARERLGTLRGAPGSTRREAAVPIAILCSLLFIHATNPYLGAAFGLAAVVLMIAWLDPFARKSKAPGMPSDEGTPTI
jgi:hypothetical protein